MENRSKKTAPGNAGETLHAALQPADGTRFAHNLDWNLLRVFFEIAKAGGISEAARKTARKQPALSMALRRLETQLDARLCRRGPGGFELTREGERLIEICESVYGDVTHIPRSIAEAGALVSGRVRIQLISNLVDSAIDEPISEFHRDHELVEIFVSVSTWDVIQRSVLRNEVEIGIAPVQHKRPDLTYELLFREIYRPYCGRSHALFGKIVAEPGGLGEYPLILTGADEPDQLTKFRQRHGLGAHVAGLSEHLEEARRLTVLGVGLCWLPESFAARDMAEGLLHPVLEPGDDPSSDIFVIANPQAPAHDPRDRMLAYLRRRMTGAQIIKGVDDNH